jgi:capsular polysaccharide biosynthesis protein
MHSRFLDWYRRQRAQQLMNFGRVAVIPAEKDAELTLRGTTDPEFPIHVMRDIYVAGLPAGMCRTLAPPFGIVKESVFYPHEPHEQRGMIKRFLRHDLRPVRARPLGDAMCLATFMSYNYFHWLIDTLPKVLAVEEVGFKGSYLVPPPPYARQSLEFLGISGSRIIEHDREDFWRIERLFVTPPLDYDLHLRQPNLLARLRARLRAALPKPAGRKRLYVSRNRPGITRDIVNEAELKALLGRFDFIEYFCEDHSIVDQLAAFAGTEAMIGSEGTSFANPLVMPEGALVMALGSPLRFNTIGPLVSARVGQLKYYTVISHMPFDGSTYLYGSRVVADLPYIETTLERELA